MEKWESSCAEGHTQQQAIWINELYLECQWQSEVLKASQEEKKTASKEWKIDWQHW